MPDDDEHEIGHRDYRVQQWQRYMDALQESDLLPMRHHQQGRDENTDHQREGTDLILYWQTKGRRSDPGKLYSETKDWQNRTLPEEQQNINIETCEIRGDQINDGRSKRGHNGRATPRSSSHGLAKNEGRQEFQNQRGHGLRPRRSSWLSSDQASSSSRGATSGTQQASRARWSTWRATRTTFSQSRASPAHSENTQ
eukprot:3624425-Heterocapsa_arctica.AAC.1